VLELETLVENISTN